MSTFLRFALVIVWILCLEHTWAQDVGVGENIQDTCGCMEGRDCGPKAGYGYRCDDAHMCFGHGYFFSDRLDNSPDCKRCPLGYYYDMKTENNQVLVLPHQQVASIQIVTTWEPDISSPNNILEAFVDLFGGNNRKVETEMDGPTFQTCQHCPLHTIVNSQYSMTLTSGSTVEDFLIMDNQPRCFTSCYSAYQIMNLPNTFNKFTIPNLQRNLEIREAPANPFPEIDVTTFDFQLWHMVPSYPDMKSDIWFTPFKNYVQMHHTDFSKLLKLPPPERQCRACAPGKTRFTKSCRTPTEPACANFIEKVKLLKASLSPDQGGRLGDVSWLNADAVFNDFRSIDVCEDCPVGTYFNSYDMTLAVKDYTGKKEVWDLKKLRCRPCPENSYTQLPGEIACKSCNAKQYTLIESRGVLVNDEIGTGNSANRKVETELLVDCLKCPAGSEYSSNSPCSSKVVVPLSLSDDSMRHSGVPNKNICCNPCGVNTYSDSGDYQCLRNDGQPTLAPYGQTKSTICGVNFKKRHCIAAPSSDSWKAWRPEESPCLKELFYTTSSWLTCVPCLKTEKPVAIYQNEYDCELCNEVTETPGEFYQDGRCQTCPDCSVLNTTFILAKFAWESQSQYTSVLSTWGLPWSEVWKYQVVQIECVPLRRRKLSWNGTSVVVSGEDYYKIPAKAALKRVGALYMEERVALFHAVQYHKLENDQRKCEHQHCQSFCKEWVFQYSDRCGDRVPDPWLQLRTNTVLSPQTLRDAARSISSGAARVEDYDILFHGKCTKCQTCRSGEYNDECNVWDASKLPQGQCKACRGLCVEADHFLWHSYGLYGCHNSSKSRAGEVEENYVCKRCPTWIRENNLMYTVLGCGNKASFPYFEQLGLSYSERSFTLSEVRSKYGNGAGAIDIKYQPYLHLVPYCPPNTFFEAAFDCAFEALTDSILGPARPGVLYGHDAYQLKCCKLCTVCDSSSKRVDNKWRKCEGYSTFDTEGVNCVSKCQSGYYDSNSTAPGEAGTCIPCKRCARS